MNLIIESQNDFNIINNKIVSEDGFKAVVRGNNLILHNGSKGKNSRNTDNNCNNFSGSVNNIGMSFGSTSIGLCGDFKNINITPENISFNDYSFSFKNGELYINGIKYENNAANCVREKDLDDVIFEYPLEVNSIFLIEISTNANLDIKDASVLSNKKLELAIRGNGTITLKDSLYSSGTFKASIQGSGTINFNSLKAEKCKLAVQGNGIIAFKNSNFDILKLLVMGPGIIIGAAIISKDVSKDILGPGTINIA